MYYHNANLNWLKSELVPHLEESEHHRPLKLCIHNRDWLGGTPIEDNILMSIKRSRQTIVLLSQRFINSNWCQFELQMARLESIDKGQELIIVVALEDIPVSQMTSTLINHLI